MRLLLVLAAFIACGPLAPPTEVDPLAGGGTPKPPLRGTRMVLPEDRIAEPLEVSVTSPVSPGDTASATARATAGARCTIRVSYASGPSEAQGLGPATADDTGYVSWSWIVGINTTTGDWPVEVQCARSDGRRAAGRVLLTVGGAGPAPPTGSGEGPP